MKICDICLSFVASKPAADHCGGLALQPPDHVPPEAARHVAEPDVEIRLVDWHLQEGKRRRWRRRGKRRRIRRSRRGSWRRRRSRWRSRWRRRRRRSRGRRWPPAASRTAGPPPSATPWRRSLPCWLPPAAGPPPGTQCRAGQCRAGQVRAGKGREA